MRISDEQVKAVLGQGQAIVTEIQDMDLPLDQSPRPDDGPMIAELTQAVINAPDREGMVAELKARIESGQYNPTGEEIADAMVRRAIADRVR